MDGEEAFLKTIADTPADIGNRLVYADWLDENGDSRCELIRLECEMASLPAYSEKYAKLKLQRNQLRAQTDGEWLTLMGYVPRHRPILGELPSSRAERWRLVEELIENWFSTVQAKDGYAETELAAAEHRLGVQLPTALREWYLLTGKRMDVWSCQDTQLHPQKLELDAEDDALFFRVECQGCDWLGIRSCDLEMEDPPVYRFGQRGVEPRDTPRQVSPTVTAFALAVLLLHIPLQPRFVGGDCSTQAVWSTIEPKVTQCDLPERCFRDGASPIYFYETTDVILMKSEMGDLMVVARNENAIDNLSSTLREKLERW